MDGFITGDKQSQPTTIYSLPTSYERPFNTRVLCSVVVISIVPIIMIVQCKSDLASFFLRGCTEYFEFDTL